MQTSNLPRLFTYSTGALLLAAALGMFISVCVGIGRIHPHDPLFTIPITNLFWIIGGLELLIALICLFGKQVILQVALVFWLAMNFIVYQIGLWLTGISGGFKGYLGDMSAAFGISCGTADMMLKTMVLYLFTGSSLSLLWLWTKKESGDARSNTNGCLKTCCPACGGHITFPSQNLGQKIPCPHCQMTITLRKPENLKMACFFCKGHIEFPVHAIGEKIPCPHCNMDITLMEPA
jgi:hypothetical protein